MARLDHADDDEHTLPIVGVAREVEHPQNNRQIPQHDDAAADKAERFPDGGENEVRPVGGDVVQLTH